MKTHRFFALFLSMALLCSLLSVTPALADEPAAVESMQVAAKAALLVDENSGTILYGENEHTELYPASLTKIMTALLVLEAIDSGKLSLDQQLTVTSSAMSSLASDGSSAGIKVGEVLTVENLLYCMLIVSANEACNILAEAVAGSVDVFVDSMNEKAAELGCKNTHFANATGLHDSQHYTSAWDLYLITKEAMTHELFMTICDTPDVIIPATNLSEQRHLYTTNYLLSAWRAVGYKYSDAHGIKTGSTSEAGHCLVSSATQGSRTLISVVLGANKIDKPGGGTDVQSFSETKRLFLWGFSNFSTQTVLTDKDLLAEIPVTLSKTESVALHPAGEIRTLLPVNLKVSDLEKTVTLKSQSVEAPVQAGQVLGSVTLSYDGTVYAQTDLVALNDVEASRILTIWHNIQLFFDRTIVKILCVVLGALLLLAIFWKLTLGRRRYRYGKTVRHSSGYRGRKRR